MKSWTCVGRGRLQWTNQPGSAHEHHCHESRIALACRLLVEPPIYVSDSLASLLCCFLDISACHTRILVSEKPLDGVRIACLGRYSGGSPSKGVEAGSFLSLDTGSFDELPELFADCVDVAPRLGVVPHKWVPLACIEHEWSFPRDGSQRFQRLRPQGRVSCHTGFASR